MKTRGITAHFLHERFFIFLVLFLVCCLLSSAGWTSESEVSSVCQHSEVSSGATTVNSVNSTGVLHGAPGVFQGAPGTLLHAPGAPARRTVSPGVLYDSEVNNISFAESTSIPEVGSYFNLIRTKFLVEASPINDKLK